MPEVKTTEAAQIVGVSRITIWKDVHDGRLPAKLRGRRGVMCISIDDLRRYAVENRRLFDEKLAKEFAKD